VRQLKAKAAKVTPPDRAKWCPSTSQACCQDQETTNLLSSV
jgi:hypothetical protein